LPIPPWLAKTIYYPTLGYNLLLGRILGVRRWWDKIDEHLILGARPMPGDPVRFLSLGVTGVVNTCEEMAGPVEEYERLGIEQLWIPTTDFQHPSAENVSRGADFIEKHRQDGGCVYVHCKAGRARSATVVLWWLVRFGGLTPEEAQAKILEARPHANKEVFKRPVIQKLYAEWKSESDSGAA
jgi:atypical dual specificity phosphatase